MIFICISGNRKLSVNRIGRDPGNGVPANWASGNSHMTIRRLNETLVLEFFDSNRLNSCGRELMSERHYGLSKVLSTITLIAVCTVMGLAQSSAPQK